MSGEAGSLCVEFRVLGPFDVRRDGGTIALGAHRQRALLLMLFLHSDELVSRDRLIDELWGERAPASAPNMIQVYVSRLRKMLGPGLLVTQPPGYVLRVGEAQVDATKFVELVGKARDSLADDAAGAARDLLDEAIATWRGPPLADFAYESFAQGEIARLQELRLEAIELRIDADLTLGRQVALVGELEQLIRLHPFRERLRGQLMVALYRSGRQAEALDAYRAARSALVEELGLGPSPALRRLEQAILDQDPSLDATGESAAAGQLEHAGPAGNLPPELTSLLGRELELERVGELVERHRVVTIVGPGGVGKTRVALRVARAAANRFADGVWFVDLAPVGSSDDVAEAVSSALGMSDRPGSSTLDTLTIELRERRLLLVLDNCEHVLASAAEVTARLLGQCPDVRILATSREPLAIAGESVERLAPLATTAIGADPPAAVRLFLERAETQGARWEEPELVLETIRELCVRLDGIPLAIELAAARTRAISPAELLAKLDDRLRLLVSPHHRSAHARHQTLEATIGWSYELLGTEEQATLRRLAVFQGSFSLAAAAAVCADIGSELDALERVTALVDRSVLSVQRRAETNRYRLLESIAVFAGQHLDELDEAEQARNRHARYFQLLARAASGPEYDSEQAEWATRLDLEQDNLTGALAWCFDGEGDPAIGAELAANLGLHLIFRGRSHAARRWLGRALEVGERIPPATLVAVNLAYAHLAYSTTDIDTSVACAIDAVATARETGNEELLAEALAQLALADQANGASVAASTVAAELRTIQSRLSDPRAQVMALLGTAQVALAIGQPEQAKADASSARQIARRVGDHLRAASSGYWLAYALALKSDIRSAREAIGEATNDAGRSGYQLVVVDTLIAATSLALVDGDVETASRLLPTIVTMLREQQRWEDLGACLRLAAAVELRRGSPERSAVLLAASLRWTDHLDFQDELLLPELAELGELLNARLGEGAFAAMSERGAEMSLEGVASFIAS
jgi:predicted ATPase/DNA-binding SARP family transcriptional activator